MPRDRFDEATHKMAFKLWRRNDGNFSAVSRYEGMPSTPTLIKWAEEENWEGKVEQSKELVREVFKGSDDPTLRKLVKDEAFLLTIVGALRELASYSLKTRRRKVAPRTTHDLVELLKFIADVEEKSLPRTKPGQTSVDKVSVRKAVEDILGGDLEAKKMAGTIVHDVRKRLRLVYSKAMDKEDNADEDAS